MNFLNINLGDHFMLKTSFFSYFNFRSTFVSKILPNFRQSDINCFNKIQMVSFEFHFRTHHLWNSTTELTPCLLICTWFLKDRVWNRQKIQFIKLDFTKKHKKHIVWGKKLCKLDPKIWDWCKCLFYEPFFRQLHEYLSQNCVQTIILRY